MTVVVIGAGLAGCSVAYHLAPHARVIVVDQAAQPGAEASSQNAGMVRRLGEDPWERALAVRTAAFLEEPGPEWDGLALSRRVGGAIGLARDPHHLHDGVAHLRARGIRVEAGAPDLPALAGSPVSRWWWLPDERVADPHALITGFVRVARAHGAEVRCRTRVTGLRPGWVVETDSGPIRADAVVIAAGAWSGAIARELGLARPLIPLRRTLVQSAPHPLSADHPWVWVDDVGIYARPEAGGWLVSPCDETVSPAGPRGPVDPLHRALAHDKLDRYLPALSGVRFTGGWTGLRTFAPDRRPVLGADPDAGGLWWAAGLGGFGVTCSYAVGEAVASWIRGEATDWLDPAGVSPGRPFLRRWPIRPAGDLHDTVMVSGRSPLRARP